MRKRAAEQTSNSFTGTFRKSPDRTRGDARRRHGAPWLLRGDRRSSDRPGGQPLTMITVGRVMPPAVGISSRRTGR